MNFSIWAVTRAYVWPAYALTAASARLERVVGAAVLRQRWRRARRRRRQCGVSHDSAAQAPGGRSPDRLRASAPRPRSRCRRSRTTCSISTTRRRSLAGEAPAGRTFRLGGMVEKGSVKRARAARGPLHRHRFPARVPVSYTGVLPDLFREGQGVIAHGQLDAGRRVRRRGSARQARRELHAARSAESLRQHRAAKPRPRRRRDGQ